MPNTVFVTLRWESWKGRRTQYCQGSALETANQWPGTTNFPT